jgi:hypothetical protein
MTERVMRCDYEPELLLDDADRHLLRLWLMGKERPHQIDKHRWALLTTAATGHVTLREICEIVDVCGGTRILDILMGKDTTAPEGITP